VEIKGVVVKRVMVHDVEKLISRLGERVQLVSGECIEEVVFAALISMRAFERRTNRAKTLGGELLLRLAGTHQIKEAIKFRGAGNGPRYLVVFGSGGEAENFVREFGLKELEPEHCDKDTLKPLMEKIAIVEAL